MPCGVHDEQRRTGRTHARGHDHRDGAGGAGTRSSGTVRVARPRDAERTRQTQTILGRSSRDTGTGATTQLAARRHTLRTAPLADRVQTRAGPRHGARDVVVSGRLNLISGRKRDQDVRHCDIDGVVRSIIRRTTGEQRRWTVRDKPRKRRQTTGARTALIPVYVTRTPVAGSTPFLARSLRLVRSRAHKKCIVCRVDHDWGVSAQPR